MKRTTLALDDELLRQLKKRAAENGTTLQALANDLLRQAVARAARCSDFKLALLGWEAEEQPGVDILDRDSLYDLMDESRD